MAGQLDRRGFLRVSGGVALGAAVLGSVGLNRAGASYGVTAGKPPVPGSFSDANGSHSLAYFGIYDPAATAGISEPEKDLEPLIGRKFAINHCFRQPFDAAYAPIGDRMRLDRDAGRIPMLSWAAGPDISDLNAIANGSQDTAIDGQAVALANLNTPIFMRFTWEFDIRYTGTSGATAHIAAWRHVWSRFQTKGATNVAFVWCPTYLAYQDSTATNYYPGDGYVDWIGADGYARPNNADDTPTFSSLFTNANVFATNHSKPFMVGETGAHRFSQEDGTTTGTTAQSRWINAVSQNLADDRFANMKALLYFHVDGDNNPLPNHWRVTVPSNGPAFQAFNTLASKQRLSA